MPAAPATDSPTWVEAFDRSAPTYDQDFTHQPLAILFREMVWQECDRAFPRRGRLLDLGSGTGEDAVYFAQRGLQVTAVDGSAEMVKEAGRKFRRMRLEKDDATALRLPLDRLGELEGAPFDAALANFGVVNCLESLEAFRDALARHLKPGAPFVAVPMGRLHPGTEIERLRRGQVGRLLERVRSPSTHVPVQGVEVAVRYWTPAELERALSPAFALSRTRAIGAWLPPPHLSGLYRRHRRLFLALQRLDERTAHLPGVRALGDHVAMVFVRN